MNHLIEHIPSPSCHRTLRRPFGKRGTWNFDVPRSEALKREQRREAVAREMQRQIQHTRWAARKAWQYVEFEAVEADGLARGIHVERKRAHADVLYLLANKEWLAGVFRKLGVDNLLIPYATRLLKKLCGI